MKALMRENYNHGISSLTGGQYLTINDKYGANPSHLLA